MSMPVNQYFKSERLLYRPLQMEDVHPYVKMCNEASRRRWFYFQEPHCLTEAFWIRGMENNIATWSRRVNVLKDDCGLAIVRKEDRALIGLVGISKFHGPEEELADVEIGYHIGEAYQGNGYGTEAAIAAVEWGLAELREFGAVPKIVGKAEHENKSSRRVLEKAGFTFVHEEPYLSVYERIGD
ncbi:GNAT family N-acetyltransferase [Gorillibacterium timonense]|uniref:GNAT family N-acetyltransferase n=1 Tax=Gorillibacterium timonense TaxID=1689269 RepID=UPI00071E12AA|nr:GNAT family N-acetyltransferase [Gorillibacterium timonense]